MGFEQEIENNLLKKLDELKYVYRDDIKDRASLEDNFRQKFEELNNVELTDSEFKRLLEEIITPDVFTAAKTLRNINSFIREDETPLNYTLVNIKDWCKNSFEVVNQLRINTDNSHHRYDVILLINGIPVAQIELKTPAINPRRAMQQIVNYKNDAGNGYTRTLMCFMQIFIVSNNENTWYFANNDISHFSFDADEKFLPLYEFADEDNEKITHLDKFANKFLTKCTLGEMISRYMVLVESEKKLLMMRPYQIYAVKNIVACINENSGNGYIWHTTGSGKTLTSFKASTLLKDNPDIEKCLFVVDRKDLDRQTREEFNRFQEGCVEENTNTRALVERLLSDDYADKVIVTTIQKLGLALDEANKNNYKERLKPLRDKRVVFIFDECHRSQFGDNHRAIKEFFNNSQLFGFTGTPIFEENANYIEIDNTEASYKTTESIFQKQLHAYTITHAIEDRNVLRFQFDSFEPKEKIPAGQAIPKEVIINAILENHDIATSHRKFNAIFATSSINNAIEYYNKFKGIQEKRKAEDNTFRPLNIACVFSPPAEGDKDIKQIQEDLIQERKDNKEDPRGKKKALKAIIADYNEQYGTNHSITEFDSYYQDVQKRIKDQQYPNTDLIHSKKIDLIIVVDMLLTGFDSKYLNTLYVDKKLKHHGLIQAFSRTNRVLNATKPNGNILDYCQQEDAMNEAIALFSGVEGEERAREIWLVDEAPVVIEKLGGSVQELNNFMQSQGVECSPEGAKNLKGDEARVKFVELFKDVQRHKMQLDQYTDLKENHIEAIEKVIPEKELLSYKSVYLETARQLKEKQDDGTGDAEVQNLDLELVLFTSAVIDYDYIMKLIARYSEISPQKQKMNREKLMGLIASDAKFMNEREDIREYIESLEVGKKLKEEEIKQGYEKFKKQKNDAQITEIASTYEIEKEEFQKFIDNILARMIFDDEDLTDLLTPQGLGWKERTEKKVKLMKELIPLLNKLAHGREIFGLNSYEI